LQGLFPVPTAQHHQHGSFAVDFFLSIENVVQLKRKNTTFSGNRRSLKWLKNRSTGACGLLFFARKLV
jgi:hypothetical protein